MKAKWRFIGPCSRAAGEAATTPDSGRGGRESEGQAAATGAGGCVEASRSRSMVEPVVWNGRFVLHRRGHENTDSMKISELVFTGLMLERMGVVFH